MPRTPQKKRSGSLVVSPEATTSKNRPPITSAATERDNLDERRRRKNYQFAPINNLDNNNKPENSVLKSISVSQVRNTSYSNSKKVQRSKQQQKATLQPSFKNDPILKPVRRQESLEEGPTEEVIWKYSPTARDLSDKVNSSNDNSEDNVQAEKDQEPSSTPLVPKRLKSVLSFTNINDREQSEPPLTTLSMQQRDSLRSRGTTDSMKESLRDIDDILGDIEGDLSMKPKLNRVNDLPSSPSGIQQRQENVEEDYEDSDSNNGDESLINILTQKPSLDDPTPELPAPGTTAPAPAPVLPEHKSSSDNELLDDSLLDYFEEDEKNNDEITDNHANKDLEDLNQVGKQFSQNLNIEKNGGNEDPESSDSEIISENQEFIELAKSAVIREGVERLVILNVSELQLPKVGRQKILHCIDHKGETSSVMVRHPWVYLEFSRGDAIHIIQGQNVDNKRLLSDDINPKTNVRNDNLLVLNPDILLSATTVGNSIGCLRRSTIETIFDDPRGEPKISMTIGNIVHELLQDALRCKLENQKLTVDYLEEVLDSLLKTYSFAIFVCNYTIEQVKDEIMNSHATNILQFVNQFVQKSNLGSYVSISGRRTTRPISIPVILDIEENILSHIYGLKGFLDATVLAHEEKKHEIVPLEVKTGKLGSVSHEAQGLIYTLLLKDKYEVPVDFFLLLQTRTNNFIKHPKILHSIKHVIMARNQLATKLKYRLKEITWDKSHDVILPPILQSSVCDNCFTKESCMVLNNLLEDGTAEESGLRPGEYETITSHLSTNHDKYGAFFKKYNDLITQEESSIMHIKKQLFLLDSNTKESTSGLCLSNLCLVDISEENSTSEEFLHVFKRNFQEGQKPQSMLLSQLNVNDYVFISDERGHFGLCQGRVTSITRGSITICSKKRLRNPEVVAKEILSAAKKQPIEGSQPLITYRLDKNVIEQGLSLTRFNLLNLFLPPVTEDHFVVDQQTGQERSIKKSEGGDQRMRTFLVDKAPPEFIPDELPPLIPYDPNELESFNYDQRKAVGKVMRAKDYALILGMPGSGKTTVIAQIIKILASRGQKVLLTSYTHSAVDNILLKLKGSPINIIRLGSARKIHPEIHEYQPSYQDAESYEDIMKQISDTQVVATTCLGLNDIFFTLQQKDFDYAILDEASQISMPVALGPLRYASKFIMVGDHYQLPPLVRNEEARLGGLQESLFKILCEAQPKAVIELTYQYRMCDDVAALSNFLIYSNKLKCGNEQVARKKINLPRLKELKNFHCPQELHEKDWLCEILEPHKKVIFLNYDLCEEEQLIEINEQKTITNPGEVDIAEQCVNGLIHAGMDCRDIGVMTLYRAQLQLLNTRFASDHYSNLEILTADQFQGRDKESIIISLVRSNVEHNAGSLLRELRRVNVAMTRAKSKLIIIGSRATISSVPQMARLVSFLHSKGWIYDLPHHFRDFHKFPISSPSSSFFHSSQGKNKSYQGSTVDHKSTNDTERKGAKNITASSQLVKDHPIIKQSLLEF
ncbi:hypothetical protein ZYGR_0I04850 [Zygosaccharomyces rouxii]|uniref:DNA replication ATP-dependent helicase/nuclease DNA2 n=1 Tax=Zygosaccharomyces rouxii TaxID=4956 RepID=A0A1Q2ZXT9_ZYGRO|nr:hypothetical protein ZYGR_0I04850 [Zygosaccharomyces rouxii]